MSAQCLTIIHYRASAVCFLKKYLLFNISVLWPWVSPPLPPMSPGLSGGSSLFLSVGVFGCMNGAWLPVCPLGGSADDLPRFRDA